MKNLNYVIVCAALAVMGVGPAASAQEVASGYNPNSVHPIHESDIMYEKRIWRRMDLQEKQNRPFFARNNEITKIIIEAVKQGVLFPYMNDSLKNRMSKETFLENLKIPETGTGLSEEEKALGFSDDQSDWASDWGSEEETSDDTATAAATETEEDFYFLPQQVTVLEIMEDMIFDKKRSRLYWDIQSVKLILPPENFPESGLLREVGVFRYKDLVELFRSMPEEAIWFNPQNSAAHRNLADAFALRLFNARIIKIANPKDEMIIDIYSDNPRDGIMASQRLEGELLELEHNLWEF